MDSQGVGAAGRYRDREHYIGYGSEQTRVHESALQPQAGEGGTTGGIAQQLEAALLDVTPDNALDMARKRRAYHWDARKGKYIKTTVGELAAGGVAANGTQLKGSKRLRTESGAREEHAKEGQANVAPGRPLS